jgi:hypothetical protein
MSKLKVALETISKGPNCEVCPAVEQCPAMKLSTMIDELNDDLLQEGLSDGVKTRVQGEIFAYGTQKFSSEIDNVNSTISNCLGAVAVAEGEHFMYPSMSDELTSEDKSKLWEGPYLRHLVQRGFKVYSQKQGLDDLHSVSIVKDPNAAGNTRIFDIGYTNQSGLRSHVSDFRKAASFVSEKDY